MSAAHAEVAEFAGVAQGDFAVWVDAVGAGAPFGFGTGVWCGFVCGGVGVFGGAAAQGPVGSVGVVPVPELVEQVLKVVDGVRAWSGPEPAFEGLVESFDFALGLRVRW